MSEVLMSTRLLAREVSVITAGAVHIPDWLNRDQQVELAMAYPTWVEGGGGPRFPVMPSGGVMSVDVTCLGRHWVPYRYTDRLVDVDKRQVQPMPRWLAELGVQAVADAREVDSSVIEEGVAYQPDVALANWYDVNYPHLKVGAS